MADQTTHAELLRRASNLLSQWDEFYGHWCNEPRHENALPPAGTVTLQEDIAEALAAPAVLEPLTAERLQKHAMFAADAPPASAVVLVSSLHRLLGITGDSNG